MNGEDDMKLVKPTISMKEEFLDYLKECVDEHGSEKNVTPYAVCLFGKSYEEWLDMTYRFETEPDSGLVPASTYLLVDDSGRVLGAINIRHELNEYLKKVGGHIGYGIRPSERQKGYATKMLEMALPIAKELGIERALITCDKDNVASAKTIINNSGVLENEIEVDGKITQRYWIYSP